MSEVRRSAHRQLFIRSDGPLSGGMTVWHLRDFVATLDREGVADSEPVTDHHANDTRHLINLSVNVHEETPVLP